MSTTQVTDATISAMRGDGQKTVRFCVTHVRDSIERVLYLTPTEARMIALALSDAATSCK